LYYYYILFPIQITLLRCFIENLDFVLPFNFMLFVLEIHSVLSSSFRLYTAYNGDIHIRIRDVQESTHGICQTGSDRMCLSVHGKFWWRWVYQGYLQNV